MGSKSHLTPGEFSQTFNDFLRRVVEAQDGRPTERWAEANMPKERGRSYWGKLLAGTQAMTTEDIYLVARWLNIGPFDFVRAVRENDLVAALVGSSSDTFNPAVLTATQLEALRQAQMDLAAKRRLEE